MGGQAEPGLALREARSEARAGLESKRGASFSCRPRDLWLHFCLPYKEQAIQQCLKGSLWSLNDVVFPIAFCFLTMPLTSKNAPDGTSLDPRITFPLRQTTVASTRWMKGCSGVEQDQERSDSFFEAGVQLANVWVVWMMLSCVYAPSPSRCYGVPSTC